MTIKRTFALLCFILPCALARAGNHESVPAPAPAVGDSWTYQYTDVWKGAKGNVNRMEVASIDEAGVHMAIKRAASGALISTQLFSPDMNPVERGGMHFSPSFTRFTFPMAPGSEWSSEVVGDNSKAGKQQRYAIKGKVLDWEKVRVPAGEFEALKIVVEAQYADANDATRGGGKLTETVWFVPSLNNYVKLDYQDADAQGRLYSRDSWELMSFAHKAATPPLAAVAAPNHR
ncbi:hypothetical protein GJ697_28625 [Pseudoduganella sp. FT25W]|jgi:hypothetical protein|uniref:DUF3108 domain-containing protein n=1 Tax=Duganella alba TaxID=2666081 RepID=A0A6L5QPR9_9BURK|nr:hypothetical protein [Duganella alba]MRX11800.1 hypothetical protein [Duganella alba]MRX19964.1 hypothetical protein [Duganella alba]